MTAGISPTSYTTVLQTLAHKVSQVLHSNQSITNYTEHKKDEYINHALYTLVTKKKYASFETCREGKRFDHHESKTSDPCPGIGKGGAGELYLTKVAGKHDGKKSDAIVGSIGQYHGHREQELVFSFPHV